MPIMATMMNVDPIEEKILRRIPFEITAAAFLMGLVALPFFGPMTAVFIAAGGVFSALGFLWMKSSLTRLLDRTRGKALRAGILSYAFRLILILVVFCLIILCFPRNILAFAAGFSALVPVFLIEGVVALVRLRSWKN
jgi:hypothetical protein